MAIDPDVKDWTWVLERPCPECGLDASAVTPGSLADAFTATVHEGTWRYYFFDVEPGSADLVVYLFDLTGDVDLYVRRGDKPMVPGELIPMKLPEGAGEG